MPRFTIMPVSVCAMDGAHPRHAKKIVSIGYKASAFDNAKTLSGGEKPLRDKDLTASIQVNS